MISWNHPGRPVILASVSPRRKRILAQMGFRFTVEAPGPFDEEAHLDAGNLASSLRRLANIKACSVAALHPQALVLGADTVVVKGKKVFGKPVGREDARAMLRSLSGSRHRVLTGVALVCASAAFSATASAVTDVFFRRLGVDEIEEYLALDEHCDKAGAYAIQGGAMIFVERINGCYYNVVGLPVDATAALFRRYVLSLE